MVKGQDKEHKPKHHQDEMAKWKGQEESTGDCILLYSCMQEHIVMGLVTAGEGWCWNINLLDSNNDILNIIGDYVKKDNADRMEELMK